MRGRLLLALCIAALATAPAQGQDQRLSTATPQGSGKGKPENLLQLAKQEREAGRLRAAVEYAVRASSEAEKAGNGAEQALALMELARAQQAKGDVENAIGAALRSTLITSTTHTAQRTEALLYLAELYAAAGYPRKALEHLEEARATTGARQVDEGRFLKVEALSNAAIMEPKAMEAYCTQHLADKAAKTSTGLQYALVAQLATAQARQGNYAGSLENEERAQRLAIGLNDAEGAAVCANNRAELYNRLGEKDRSIEAYNQGLILVEDLPGIRLNMTINAVHAMASAGHRDLAMRTLAEAKRQAGREGYKQLMPRVLLTEAAAQFVAGDARKAQDAAFASLASAEQLQDDAAQKDACDLLSMVFDRLQLDQEARQYDRRARDIEARIANNRNEAKADQDARLLRLQRIEREQTDLLNREQRKETKLRQLALDAENRDKQVSLLLAEKQLQESANREAALAKEKAEQDLRLVQVALETERQQRQIQDLDNSRMLQSLNLSRMKAEQKEQQRGMELLQQKNRMVELESEAIKAKQARQQAVRNLIIAMAVAALVFAIWMLWSWAVMRRKKRIVSQQNHQIKTINEELHTKNMDIESSLGYARTIQSTIIPSEETLRNLIPDSFLLYKPLHNVSGDLPYVRRIGDRIYVAAIDCTGHGVPAAMMTFIAYYGLNELIEQDPAASSGPLLDRLHQHVRKVMDRRQEGGLYNDGFDISLCVIDLAKGELVHSGSQLPLLLVRSGAAQHFKGDIFPLGDDRFQRAGNYKEHRIRLEQGDTLYLFSDGIIHQLGGETGRKKFSMKRLTEILERTSAMDLQAVKTEAEQAFLEWKENQTQTDDVLLIGVRYAA